jgi:hypothetical protein
VWKCGCSDEAEEKLEEERAKLIKDGMSEAEADKIIEKKKKEMEEHNKKEAEKKKLQGK